MVALWMVSIMGIGIYNLYLYGTEVFQVGKGLRRCGKYERVCWQCGAVDEAYKNATLLIATHTCSHTAAPITSSIFSC